MKDESRGNELLTGDGDRVSETRSEQDELLAPADQITAKTMAEREIRGLVVDAAQAIRRVMKEGGRKERISGLDGRGIAQELKTVTEIAWKILDSAMERDIEDDKRNRRPAVVLQSVSPKQLRNELSARLGNSIAKHAERKKQIVAVSPDMQDGDLEIGEAREQSPSK